MLYRTMGSSEVPISEIGLGTMMFGEKTSEAEATRILHHALDSGVNLIDVADVYAAGESERIVGRSLHQRRHQAFLATKVGRRTPEGEGLSAEYIQRAVEASLRRLQTDYIDLYQVHRWDPHTPLEETLEALYRLVQSGKVRYIGCSNYEADQLRAAMEISKRHRWPAYVSVQPRYNLVYRGAEAELLPVCLREGIGVLAYSPLAGGILTGKYRNEIPKESRAWQNEPWQASRLTPEARSAAERVSRLALRLQRPPGQVAIRWCLAHPAVTSALVGPRTLEQWQEAVASTWRLDPAEVAELSQDI